MKEITQRILMAMIGGIFIWEAILALTISGRYLKGIIALIIGIILVSIARFKAKCMN